MTRNDEFVTPPPITDFSGKIAVITGGGSGMGRELTRLLAQQGCSVAICDLDQASMDTTVDAAVTAASASAFASARFTTFVADVSDADQMAAFAAHVAAEFRTERVELLFNNAGVGGAGSFVTSSTAAWDDVFGVCWGGVLNGSRAFLPMLLASERGQIINTSSINGMWACLGPRGPHTAYSAAKFAVRGFTEALNVDFRINAPHLTAMVVMPGHIGTSIMRKSMERQGLIADALTDDDVATIRADLTIRGIDLDGVADDDIRAGFAMRVDGFEHAAPTSAADAAQAILDGITSGAWRLLIGNDADALDAALRADPEAAYSFEFTEALLGKGHLGNLIIN